MKQYVKEAKEGLQLKTSQAIREQKGVTKNELEMKQVKSLSLSLLH